MNGGYSMKEYIKPEVEVIEYSFEDIIAGSIDAPAEETPIPDENYNFADADGDGVADGNGDGNSSFFT